MGLIKVVGRKLDGYHRRPHQALGIKKAAESLIDLSENPGPALSSRSGRRKRNSVRSSFPLGTHDYILITQAIGVVNGLSCALAMKFIIVPLQKLCRGRGHEVRKRIIVVEMRYVCQSRTVGDERVYL